MGVGGGGGVIRLAFRVKTNRGSDDEDYGQARSFSSGTRGAAIVDNVVVTQGGPNLVDFGDFENANSVDNAALTTAAWHSTGKPPGIYIHVHTVDPGTLGAAPWNDPCSPPSFAHPSAPNRTCNMISNVITGGDHDNLEKPAARSVDKTRIASGGSLHRPSTSVRPAPATTTPRASTRRSPTRPTSWWSTTITPPDSAGTSMATSSRGATRPSRASSPTA
jgi:hypothetical protein